MSGLKCADHRRDCGARATELVAITHCALLGAARAKLVMNKELIVEDLARSGGDRDVQFDLVR